MTQTVRWWSLGERTLDAELGRVIRPDGEAEALSPTLQRMLAAILEGEGEPVPKERVVQQVWELPLAQLGMQARLDTTLRRLRRALGDASVIVTEPGGYRWVGRPGAGPRLPRPVSDEPVDLLGREALVERALELARSRRCITLTGGGGVGKSTLLEAVGRSLGELRRVDLATLPAGGVESLLEAELAACSPEGWLLVDHAEGARAQLARWVALALGRSELRILLASQAALNIQGETVLLVEPLSEEAPRAHLRQLLRRVSIPRQQPDPRQLDELVELAAGSPMALGLAASALEVLGPEELLRQLRAGDWPAERRRGLAERAASMEASRRASLDLLGKAELAGLERLAWLSGAWDVELASALLGPEVLDPVALLDELRHAGLVLPQPGGGYRVDPHARRVVEPTAPSEELRAQLLSRAADWGCALVLGCTFGQSPVDLAAMQKVGMADLERSLGWGGPAEQRLWATLGGAVVAAYRHWPAAETWLARLPSCSPFLDALVAYWRGRVAYREGQREAAAAHYARVERLLGAEPGPQARLLGILSAHTLAGLLRDREARLAALGRLEAHLARRPDAFFEAQLARWKSAAAFDRADWAEAEWWIRQAIPAFAAAGHAPNEARCRGMFATCQMRGASPRAGLARVVEAIEQARRAGDLQCLGTQLGNLGCYHMERGDLGPAVASFREGIASRAAQGRPAVVHLGNLGRALVLRGEADEAHACLLQARSGLEAIGDRSSVGIVCLDLAALALHAARFEEAARLFDEAWTALASGRPTWLDIARCQSAELALWRGDPARARRLLEEVPDRTLESGISLGGRLRADLLWMAGRSSEAEALARELLALAELRANRLERALCSLHLANLVTAEEALPLARSSHALVLELEAGLWLPWVLQQLGAVLLELGRLDEAQVALDGALDRAEASSSLIGGLRSGLLQARLAEARGEDGRSHQARARMLAMQLGVGPESSLTRLRGWTLDVS